jgi:hypothetical protein
MDPITAAIVASLPSVTSEIVKTSVKDAYEALKAILLRKFGPNSAMIHSIGELEANPTSKGQAAVLAENIAAAHVSEDAEITRALGCLIDELKTAGIGTPASIHVYVTGGHIHGVVGSNIGSVNFATPDNSSGR